MELIFSPTFGITGYNGGTVVLVGVGVGVGVWVTGGGVTGTT